MAETLVSYEPATGEVLWTGEVASAAEIDRSIDRARAAFPVWAALDSEVRAERLRAFQATVGVRRDALADLIARETGKPLWDARGEAASVLAKIDITVAARAERAGERIRTMDGVRQVLRHRPHGVLAVLGPYNFPAHLPNGQIAPALLAGNTVVFKPSEFTPATAEFMLTCWRDAGLPEGVLTLVQGDGRTGRALAAHPGLDGLLFTGSAQTGAALHRQFADTPHRILALEMGGNNALIWWEGADLARAAEVVVQSAYASSGQRCTCARRLILPAAMADRALEALVGVIDRLIVGAPFETPQPFMGPLIHQAAADRIAAGFAALSAAGGRAIRPPRPLRPQLPFVAPAMIEMTGVAAPDEEWFGPLLQVVRVPDFDAALEAANATRFGLAAGLIGGDEALFERFWSGVRAGVVNWNRPTTGASSATPFGGVGASGNHRPGAYYMADACAFPVAGLEAQTPSPVITQGLKS